MWQCECGHKIRFTGKHAGKKVVCPRCLKSSVIDLGVCVSLRPVAEENARRLEAARLSRGPGTEFRKLVQELGITEKAGCGCGAMATTMNRLGVDGCRRERASILAQLEANAEKYTFTEKASAAWNAARSGLPLSLGGLLDLAIERSAAAVYPSYVNLDRIGWGDLAVFAYISLGTASTQAPLVICATGEKARHARLLGCEPDSDVSKDKTKWEAFTAEMEHFASGGTLGRLEFYADWYGVPRLFKKPELQIGDEDMAFARSLGIDRRTVLFFPDSLSPNRVWPKIYWNMLADLLEARGYRTLAFPVKKPELHRNAVDVRPMVRVAACMKLAGLGIGNDSALINWTPLADLPALAMMGPTSDHIFQHAPLIRCLRSRAPLKHKGGPDCSPCHYAFKHSPFCSETCMSLANLLPSEVAEEAVKYLRERE